MLMSNIKANFNKISLSDIDIASFAIDYNKRANQIKILAKRHNTCFKTLTTTRKLCLLYLASHIFIILL